jgi:hypothetical protein
MHIAELTTGSGLVGLHLLLLESGSRLVGLDVDPTATEIAARNAKLLGLARRARFECTDLWSASTLSTLQETKPSLLICNPPYIPEPHGEQLEIEAGAGPDGTAHLMRTLEIADQIRPRAVALSWCSLSDPGKILRMAESAGYWLRSLFMVVIADGEYSGSVHDYLRSVPHSYLNESDETLETVAPDGSARFAFLLMAGDFSPNPPGVAGNQETARAVECICEQFASTGMDALMNPVAPIPVRTWILDRWDELRLRAALHGKSGDTGISA